VEVGFPNAALALTFNEFARLERMFSLDVACRIANRLAVLSAADNLALVPSAPPVGLRVFRSKVRFGVVVSETQYLMFVPLLARATHGALRTVDLSRITAIEIQGVEQP
jgi:hypothetical protein